ncbi:MAG: hypothetical protein KGD63_02050 [Candidatus Lokiarchaeota archaeon]|nr:hypothetical protein [Candidatus Lokiarchaeota archaeon]
MAKKKKSDSSSKKTTTKKPATKKPVEKKSKTKKEDPKVTESESKQTKKRMKVNFWRTKLHDEELGIHQQLKYQAKTRWFSKNFDIEGIVEIDGKKEYIIAYNKEEWEETPKDKPKRLNLRLFTIMEESLNVGKGGNYKGGVELSVAHSLLQTYELHKIAPIFYIQLPGLKSITQIAPGWRLKGTRFSWPLLPEEKGDKFQVIDAKGVVGLGNDYELFLGSKKVGRIDGQRVQKEFEIEIYDANLAKDKTFIHTVILFACAANFMGEIEDMIEELFKQMEKTGTTDYRIPKAELDLFRNPRMMRR